MIVTPLLVGIHTVEKTDGGTRLPLHTGAVTMIESDGRRILVDTGARGYFSDVVHALEDRQLTVADIDTLILTHFHLDHAFNVAEFRGSRVIGWMHEWKDKETRRLPVVEGFEVIPGVTLLQTPGHAEEHLSVLVEQDGKKIVIAGDAINEGYMRTGEISAFFYDERLYRNSADRLLALADEIIPGHGPAFKV
ncbi:MAG TPA: MBL fold metallo-hydrolase [Candidatus Peribacteraceae bacterium]|nr:MBL fold metallo-hydrolase [Candidatus Peribacteraceae bacterium]